MKVVGKQQLQGRRTLATAATAASEAADWRQLDSAAACSASYCAKRAGALDRRNSSTACSAPLSCELARRKLRRTAERGVPACENRERSTSVSVQDTMGSGVKVNLLNLADGTGCMEKGSVRSWPELHVDRELN